MTRIDQALVALNSLHSVSITFTEYARAKARLAVADLFQDPAR